MRVYVSGTVQRGGESVWLVCVVYKNSGLTRIILELQEHDQCGRSFGFGFRGSAPGARAKTDRGAGAGAGRGARVSLSRVGVAGVSRCAGAGRRHPPPLSERGPQPPHARYSRNSPLSCTTVSFWPGAIP